MSYTIGSLFTGYGGLDIGVAEALNEESKVLWCSDVAPGPRKVLPVREPDAPNLGDITQSTGAKSNPSTSSSAAPPAKTFPWQDAAPACTPEPGPACRNQCSAR